MEYVVKIVWDEEAAVWIASSNDIPGLVVEGGSADGLIERGRYMIPELLHLNLQDPEGTVEFQINKRVSLL